MTNKQEEILKKHFDQIKVDLIAKYDELGMRASGRWGNALEADVKRTRAIMWGLDYTEYMVDGRKPGKFPPKQAIVDWIIEKGLIQEIAGQMSISSLAFLISRKISQEGTKYFKQGGTDLIDSVITPERIQMILDDVSEFHISEFTSEIESFLKQIKTAA